jgi:hypothetical protein
MALKRVNLTTPRQGMAPLLPRLELMLGALDAVSRQATEIARQSRHQVLAPGRGGALPAR